MIIGQVICKQCNHCRDIDLCKDPHVATDDQTGNSMWVCASSDCRAPYDVKEIEHYLVSFSFSKTYIVRPSFYDCSSSLTQFIEGPWVTLFKMCNVKNAARSSCQTWDVGAHVLEISKPWFQQQMSSSFSKHLMEYLSTTKCLF